MSCWGWWGTRLAPATNPPVAAGAYGGPGAGVAGRVQKFPGIKGGILANAAVGWTATAGPSKGRWSERGRRGQGGDEIYQEGEQAGRGGYGSTQMKGRFPEKNWGHFHFFFHLPKK